MTSLSTSDVLDANPGHACLSTSFSSFGAVTAFAGRVRTARCSDNNAAVREMLSQPGDGCVLVVDNHASMRVAILGESMARQALHAGWSGVLIDGAVRDVADLRALPIGILARGATPRRSRKDDGIGSIDVPIEVGGLIWRPGDYVWADLDGIVLASGTNASVADTWRTGAGDSDD